MNLINELSSMESELESLRSECRILREGKIVADFEIDQLRRRNTQLEERADYHMAGKVRLKTVLDRTGADLVAAIQQYTDEMREIAHTADDPRLIERAAE